MQGDIRPSSLRSSERGAILYTSPFARPVTVVRVSVAQTPLELMISAAFTRAPAHEVGAPFRG
jgi:hypothetical protein